MLGSYFILIEVLAQAHDNSIWITQFIKAMRDEEGKMIKNAHIIGTIKVWINS
jgi:hypothetical protein